MKERPSIRKRLYAISAAVAFLLGATGCNRNEYNPTEAELKVITTDTVDLDVLQQSAILSMELFTQTDDFWTDPQKLETDSIQFVLTKQPEYKDRYDIHIYEKEPGMVNLIGFSVSLFANNVEGLDITNKPSVIDTGTKLPNGDTLKLYLNYTDDYTPAGLEGYNPVVTLKGVHKGSYFAVGHKQENGNFGYFTFKRLHYNISTKTLITKYVYDFSVSDLVKGQEFFPINQNATPPSATTTMPIVGRQK